MADRPLSKEAQQSLADLRAHYDELTPEQKAALERYEAAAAKRMPGAVEPGAAGMATETPTTTLPELAKEMGLQRAAAPLALEAAFWASPAGRLTGPVRWGLEAIKGMGGLGINQLLGFEDPSASDYLAAGGVDLGGYGLGSGLVKGIQQTRPFIVQRHELAQEALTRVAGQKIELTNPMTKAPIGSLAEAKTVGDLLYQYVKLAGNPPVTLTNLRASLQEGINEMGAITVPRLRTQVKPALDTAKQWAAQLDATDNVQTFAEARANQMALSDLINKLERAGGGGFKFTNQFKSAINYDLELAGEQGTGAAYKALKTANNFWRRKGALESLTDVLGSKGWTTTSDGFIEVKAAPVLRWMRQTDDGKDFVKSIIATAKTPEAGEAEVKAIESFLTELAGLPKLSREAWMPIAEKVALGIVGGGAAQLVGGQPLASAAISYAAYRMPDMWAAAMLTTKGRALMLKSLKPTGGNLTPKLAAGLANMLRASVFGEEPTPERQLTTPGLLNIVPRGPQ